MDKERLFVFLSSLNENYQSFKFAGIESKNKLLGLNAPDKILDVTPQAPKKLIIKVNRRKDEDS